MESQRSQIATHNPKVARFAQVLPPLLRDNQRPPGSPKQASPAVFDSESLKKKEIFYEPATYRLELEQDDGRIPSV